MGHEGCAVVQRLSGPLVIAPREGVGPDVVNEVDFSPDLFEQHFECRGDIGGFVFNYDLFRPAKMPHVLL
jgi:hypothetical protein